MCAGYFIFAYFTASITTSFTLQGLRGAIATPADLHHVRTYQGLYQEWFGMSTQ
jgi:hypothetical protein